MYSLTAFFAGYGFVYRLPGEDWIIFDKAKEGLRIIALAKDEDSPPLLGTLHTNAATDTPVH